jgi:hypothetical protein
MTLEELLKPEEEHWPSCCMKVILTSSEPAAGSLERCTHKTNSSVEWFSGTYNSLRNLAREMQVSAGNLRYLIKGAGLYELPVLEKCRGTFFRREDVLSGNELTGLNGSNKTGGSL